MEDKKINEHIKKLQKEGKAMTNEQMEEVIRKNQRIYEAMERGDFTTLKGLGVIPEQTKKDTEEGKGSYKVGGHYIDQKLKNEAYQIHKGQLALFEQLNEGDTRKAIEKEKEEGVEILSGINLTTEGEKLLDSLLKVLHKKSSPKQIGNYPMEQRHYGTGYKGFPVIKFKPLELYKEYTGKENPSGKEIEVVEKQLYYLVNTRHYIDYKRHYYIGEGRRREKKIDRIQIYEPLVWIAKGYKGLTTKEDKEIDKGSYKGKKEEILLRFNHILIDQIDTKYLFKPIDLEERFFKATGSKRGVTKLIRFLYDWINRSKSGNHFKYMEVNEEELIYGGGLQKKYRKNKSEARERLENAFKIMQSKEIGLISKYETRTGSKGDRLYRYYIIRKGNNPLG